MGHLAQVIVRALLTDAPDRFFAFAQACATLGPEEAAAAHLGSGLEEIGRRWAGPAR